jgi:hypothetical protein
MIELRSDPYVLKSRPVQDTELDFRINLNLSCVAASYSTSWR